MKSHPSPLARLEQLLAQLLQYGTWLASAVIALGLLLALSDGAMGLSLVSTGIVLFILLPILRLSLMMIVFLHERDYRFGLIASIVLTIIALSFIVGLHLSTAGAGH